MGFFDRAAQEPIIASYRTLGKKLICPNCQNDKFMHREVLMNTSGMSFFGFDWANRSGSALICSNCSRIEWYFDKPLLWNE